MTDDNNPFQELSNIFVENQRNFQVKSSELEKRVKAFKDKFETILSQLQSDVFSTNLNLFLNLEEEAKIILSVAKEVEFQRDKILKTVELLKKSNKITLNK